METTELTNYLKFIAEIEGLKSTERTAWASSGRKESTAEHSWRLAVFAVILSQEYPKLDQSRVLTMCLIHDLGELYEGDVAAISNPDQKLKFTTEYQAIIKALRYLPEQQRNYLTEIWLEYNDNKTPEAQLVKALDKAETIIQHNQGLNPKDFNYEFNLSYGKEYFETDPLLKQLRLLLDDMTNLKINEYKR